MISVTYAIFIITLSEDIYESFSCFMYTTYIWTQYDFHASISTGYWNSLSVSRLQIWKRRNCSFVFLLVSWLSYHCRRIHFISLHFISFSIKNTSRVFLIIVFVFVFVFVFVCFFLIENLDRDQRRNLFAQEQSKKVFWFWMPSFLVVLEWWPIAVILITTLT